MAVILFATSSVVLVINEGSRSSRLAFVLTRKENGVGPLFGWNFTRLVVSVKFHCPIVLDTDRESTG